MTKICENCKKHFFRFYEEDKTTYTDYHGMLYLGFNKTLVCPNCGRVEHDETGEIISEGDPEWKK